MIVDHGSVREAANSMLVEVANLIREREPGLTVEFAHMELAQPTIEHAFEKIREAGYAQVTVLPLFFAEGKHIREDIPLNNAFYGAASSMTSVLAMRGRSAAVSLPSGIGVSTS